MPETKERKTGREGKKIIIGRPDDTSALPCLARTEPLGMDDWLNLIEARKRLVEPLFDRLTLPRLDQLKCLLDKFSPGFSGMVRQWRDFSADSPAIGGKVPFSPETQGIFGAWRHEPANFTGSNPLCPGFTMVWGLTRRGEWLKVQVDFEVIPGASYDGYGWERATTIISKKTDPRTLLADAALPPQDIWDKIGSVIKDACENRRFLYERTLAVATQIKAEEALLELVP